MKYLHTMLRVTNLDRALRFYCEGLGFVVVKKNDFPNDKFTLVFLRSESDQDDGPLLELTHNWETNKYESGNAYGHMAYQVRSIADVEARLKKNGYKLSWGPGKTPSGKKLMAFVDDPDGYEIELLEDQ